MKRWHEDIAVMMRQKRRDHLNYVRRALPLGRFRKRDAFDCGKTRCGLCHYEKYVNPKPSLQQQRADLNMREGVA